MTQIEIKFYNLACAFFAKFMNTEPKEIDWEQRRYEIAKAALCGRLASKNYSPTPRVIAKQAVELADALIDELKKTN